VASAAITLKQFTALEAAIILATTSVAFKTSRPPKLKKSIETLLFSTIILKEVA
jgi:hypothetical protein